MLRSQPRHAATRSARSLVLAAAVAALASLAAATVLAPLGCGSVATVDGAPSADADADATPSGETLDPDAAPLPDGAPADGPLFDGPIARDAQPEEPLPDTSLPEVTTLGDACPPPVSPPHVCDSVKQTGCPAGQACIDYPVTDPSGDPSCTSYLFGTQCVGAGTGTQWTPCSGNSCAAGYECWGVRGSFVCLKLCDSAGAGGCGAGLSCDALFVGTSVGLCE